METSTHTGPQPLVRPARVEAGLVIGMIDGPVDGTHPALVGARVRQLERGSSSCIDPTSPACRHGTFVASQLVGLGPAAELVVSPIFCEADDLAQCPVVQPRHLAASLGRLMDAGARIINMSVGLQGGPSGPTSALHRAFQRARRRGVLLVAAAGNGGRHDVNPLFRDSWVIPVAARDRHGAILPSSNRGGRVARQGLLAVGEATDELGSSGAELRMSGTSVAAPQVSAAAAWLWTRFPEASAEEIRRALLRPEVARGSPVPPSLDLADSERWLSRRAPSIALSMLEPTRSTMTQSSVAPLGPGSAAGRASIAAVVPQACACSTGAAVGFVYATGVLVIRMRSEGDERELQARARALGVPSDDYYSVFSKYRYLARRACWVLQVNERPAGILVPRSEAELDDLIKALAPELQTDLGVVVTGTLGSSAPPSECGGLEAPMISVTELSYFTKAALQDELRKSLSGSSGDVDRMIQRVWTTMGTWRDPGTDDEQRAKNYLALRTTNIYEKTLALSQPGGGSFWLESVTSGAQETEDGRSVIDVDLRYQNASGQTQAWRSEVDVTDLFAFQSKALYEV